IDYSRLCWFARSALLLFSCVGCAGRPGSSELNHPHASAGITGHRLMLLRLIEFGSPALERFLESLARPRSENGSPVDAAVAKIIAQVRRGGDRALQNLTWRFD